MRHPQSSNSSSRKGALAIFHISAALFLGLGIVEATTIDPLANGGFETGDLTGWKVSVPTGESGIPPTGSDPIPPGPWLVPAGTVRVESSTARLDRFGTFQNVSKPLAGDFLLAVGTGNASFKNGSTYDITVSESFSLESGDILSGWSSFYNGDYAAQDSAWVKVFDGLGTEIDTLWHEISGSISGYEISDSPSASVPYLSSTPWTSWHWTVPAANTYTLALGVTTFGDNRFASYGLYDVIEVQRVPDSSPKWLFAFTMIGVLCFWRKQVRAPAVTQSH